MDERRIALLERIGNLWRGDWSGHIFDGRDGQNWIDTAIHGDNEALNWLENLLTDTEKEYE